MEGNNMEPEVKTRSTTGLVQAMLQATERMWQADSTGTHSPHPVLWEDRKHTAEFRTIVMRPKRWQLFAAPTVDSAFWRIVLGDAWHAAPAIPNGETDRAQPWDVVVEPADDAETVAMKLEQARNLLLQAIASGDLPDYE